MVRSRDVHHPPRLDWGESGLVSTVLDTVGALVLVLDREGRIVLFNQACERTSGYSLAEVQGRLLWDSLLVPEEVEPVKAAFAQLLSGQSSKGYETHWVTRGGESRLIAWTHTSALDQEGHVEYVIGTGIDITERRQAEEGLRVAMEKYRVLFESLPLGISVSDQTGKIVEANKESERLLGLSQSQHKGRGLAGPEWRIIRPDGSPMPGEEFASVRALQENRLVENVEMGIVKEGGNITWLNVTAAPVPLEGYGVAIAYGDITQMKRTEAEREALLQQTEEQRRHLAQLTQALQQERDTLEVVMENTHAQLAYLDPQFNFVLANAAYIASSGHTKEELIGHNHFDLFPDPENQAIFEQVRDTAQPVRFLAKPFEYPDQPWRGVTYWDWTLVPLKDRAGQVQGLVLSLLDVTESKRAEQELERRNRNLRRLNRLSQEIGAPHELADLLHQVLEAVHEVVSAEGSIIWLWDQDQPGQLACRAATYRSAEQCPPSNNIPPGEGLAGWVAEHCESVLLGDARQDARFMPRVDAPGDLPAGSILAVPLQVPDELFGVMEVVAQQPNAFDAEDLMLVETLAGASAIAIENIHLHEQARQSAVAGERSRLARELHDAVSQTLFSASVIAESLPRLWERKPERVRQGLEQLQQLTHGALSEMRTLLLELRPGALAEAKLGDLLQQLGDAFASRSRVEIALAMESQRSFPADVQIALYRIAQEALNNVSKHARATRVDVGLRDAGEGVELRIRDNGRGFDLEYIPPDRLGLGILRERAEAIGATLRMSSQIGQGTEVLVCWPGHQGGVTDV